MSFFKLDTEKCKRDGICQRVCVAGIIKNDEERTPFIDEKIAKYCIGCGLCVAFCPHNACSVEKLDETQYEKVDRRALPSAESAELLIKSRRSVRLYKQKNVEEELIARVMNDVRYAPSAKNSQKTRWVITKSSAETQKAATLVSEAFEEAAKTMEDTKHATIMKALARSYRQGKDVFLRNAPHIAVAIMPDDYEWKVEDAAIALTYFEIAANANGLGTCWGGYLTTSSRAYKPLRDFFGLKNNEFFGGAQMFGYPVYKTHYIPSRKKADIIFI